MLASRLLSVAMLLAALVLAEGEAPAVPEAVSLLVRLVNRTPEAPPVDAGVPVAVKQEVDGAEPVLTTGVTGDDGTVLLTMNPRLGNHWLVAASYRDIQFSRHVVWSTDHPATIEADLSLYEPAESADGLIVQKHHVVLQPSGDHLTVREIVVFEQTAPRVFVGPAGKDGKRQSVMLALPTGYQDVQFNSGGMDCCTDFQPNRAVSSMPIMPGKTVVDFEYRLPLHAGGNTGFVKEAIYPTTSYMIMLPAGNSRLLSDELAVNSKTVSDGTLLDTAQAQNLLPGQRIAVRVQQSEAARLVSAAAPYRFSSWWLALVGGAVLLGWMLYGMRRSPAVPAAAPAASPAPPVPDGEVLLSFFVDQLAELDSAYLTNQVSRQYYERVRPRLKSELQRLLKDAPDKEAGPPHAAPV